MIINLVFKENHSTFWALVTLLEQITTILTNAEFLPYVY